MFKNAFQFEIRSFTPWEMSRKLLEPCHRSFIFKEVY